MDIRTLAILASWLLRGVGVAAGFSGLIRFRRLPPSLRYIALLAGFDMVMDWSLTALIWIVHLKSNLFLIPFIVSGEVILLALAYREVLQSATFNRVMPWVVGLFGAYALIDTFAGLGIVRNAIGVEITADLLQFGLALLYFWKLLSELRVERLRADPFFWISVGLVVYVLGDTVITLFSNYLIAHYSHNLQILVILVVRKFFLATPYCAYILALWMRPQPSASLSY